jgi:hypothetical protein
LALVEPQELLAAVAREELLALPLALSQFLQFKLQGALAEQQALALLYLGVLVLEALQIFMVVTVSRAE